jgi:transposase InsO family protein
MGISITDKIFHRRENNTLLFDQVITRFGCPRILMSNQGTHFINNTIKSMTEEFKVYQQKITPYHPQANGIVEAFNKILDNALKKFCNINRDDCVNVKAIIIDVFISLDNNSIIRDH